MKPDSYTEEENMDSTVYFQQIDINIRHYFNTGGVVGLNTILDYKSIGALLGSF